jgi:hypothetical protein
MMISYDIYDRFTMEHFPLCQSMILTTSFFLLATVYYATRYKRHFRHEFYVRHERSAVE